MATETITFTIPAIPVAQPRQRQTVIAGRPHNYTPTQHPVNAFKACARHAAREAHGGSPLEGPVELTATFIFPRPKNKRWKTKPMPREPKPTKPDLGNVEKALEDALTGLLYRDDAQIIRKVTDKWIASGLEQPHVLVMLRRPLWMEV